MHAYIYYSNPLPRAECDISSILKRSLSGKNSDFPSPYTGCCIQARESSLHDYSPITGTKR